MVRVTVCVRIRFSVWLASGYAHEFMLYFPLSLYRTRLSARQYNAFTGMTALLFAVEGNFSWCVRELLSVGACPDGPCVWSHADIDDDRGCVRTPLVVCMLNGCVSSARVLLQAGCRLDKPSLTESDSDDGGDEVVLPCELFAAQRCSQSIRRLVTAAATALGLQVRSVGFSPIYSSIAMFPRVCMWL